MCRYNSITESDMERMQRSSMLLCTVSNQFIPAMVQQTISLKIQDPRTKIKTSGEKQGGSGFGPSRIGYFPSRKMPNYPKQFIRSNKFVTLAIGRFRFCCWLYGAFLYLFAAIFSQIREILSRTDTKWNQFIVCNWFSVAVNCKGTHFRLS